MTTAIYNHYVRVCKEKGLTPSPMESLVRNDESEEQKKKVKREIRRRSRKKDEIQTLLEEADSLE